MASILSVQNLLQIHDLPDYDRHNLREKNWIYIIIVNHHSSYHHIYYYEYSTININALTIKIIIFATLETFF